MKKSSVAIKTIAISKINPAPYNPRVALKPGEAEYEALRRSIEEFGYVEPLVWNAHNGVLVGGHQRLNVLKDLGFDEVDVTVVDIKDERREKALNIALNKIQGTWDIPKLKDLLVELDDGEFDLTLTGFEAKDIQSLVDAGGIPPPDADDTERKRQVYAEGEIKQIVLYFGGKEYDGVLNRLEQVVADFSVDNHTEAFLKLLEFYENNRGNTPQS